MVQKTTEEFAFRLGQAMDSHPRVPPSQHGRVTWLMRELETVGVKVSLNTVHKWVNGAARPREDRIRDLAKLLKVDEVWLALGKKPVDGPQAMNERVGQASGAVLAVAGLIELCGGRVTFPTPGEGPHLRANLSGREIEVVAVAPQVSGDKLSFIVPEPAKNYRIVAVLPRCAMPGESVSRHLELLDISGIERQNFGGFSVLELRRNEKGEIKLPRKRDALEPLGAVTELA